ncbi:MAG: hypothetical protein A2X42_05050 [Candidatus Margulisbacteria bacterium GWF2_38_17]|nr:MAG: hypothetical protein A2X42_05050 [Candidatus Margulisbacteria bacterium GWF2_38_17]
MSLSPGNAYNSENNLQPALKSLELAKVHFQNGELIKAELLCQEILLLAPSHAETLNLLGIISNQQGDNVRAITFLSLAIENDPSIPDFYNNLGNVLLFEGKLDEAINYYQEALKINPDFYIAQNNRGFALQKQGNHEMAMQHFQAAIKLNPDYFHAYNNIGMSLHQQNKLEDAISYYQKVINLKTDFVEAYYNIGLALTKQKKLEQAINYFQEAVHYNPEFFKAYYSIALIYFKQHKLTEAIEYFKETIHRNPQLFLAHYHLGLSYLQQNNTGEANACFQETARLSPQFADAFNFLGICQLQTHDYSQAITSFQTAIEIKPDFADAYCNWGNTLSKIARIDEALEQYRQALRVNPHHSVAHSNILLSLHFYIAVDPATIFEEHKRWFQLHAASNKMITAYENNFSQTRPLRIGYVSPNFSLHSVGFFIAPVIARHDRKRITVVCYSDIKHPDAVTKQFETYADIWRDINGKPDEEVIELIKTDRIDILVDLAGHTDGNRLSLFASKPAPLQITYLGYPNTTGLPAIDYRITDTYADPQGLTDKYYSENLFRLPSTFLCYQPHNNCPEVGELPFFKNGFLTFGSFSILAKINSTVIRLWSTILNTIPNSRLILKTQGLLFDETLQKYQALFAENGIASERITFKEYLPYEQHMNIYNSIDISLDTFPYNGTATTCESLWMGVPVITLEGNTHVSRVGVSLLSNIGLSSFIAQSQEEYTAIAINLANTPDILYNIRKNLREMMRQSRIMDAQHFTQDLETAYTEMWRHYCSNAAD